tara:strand:- start:656 stop:2041 length:1386 start_codon:yes stop_codon:yes gene_type:complete
MIQKYFILIFIILYSCKQESIDENIKLDGDLLNDNVLNITPDGSEKYLNFNSDYIFDQKELRTYDLILPKPSLAEIDSDPAAEKYVEGMLVFEQDTISPVGIRYKGSVGAFVGCTSGPDFSNPSGYKTCTKLSMKVKINWKGRDEKFFNLKKLQFHSQNLDDSKLHERLGYWLFREMGVIAPRSVHARLNINGEFLGLYALTEQIDSQFVEYNFQDKTGNLYKEVWPIDFKGNLQTDQSLEKSLKTNEDEKFSFDIIKSFGEQILESKDEIDLKDVIISRMDVEKIMALIIVDRLIRNDDGPFHWYCDENEFCSNHNYYWYEDPSSKKLYLIPWDLDNAFENIIFSTNPVTPIADNFGETTNNCEPFEFGPWNIKQWSASCDKLTKGWSYFSNELLNTKINFLNGPFEENLISNLINEWIDQIDSSIIEESDIHSDAISYEKWSGSLDYLISQLSFVRSSN